MGSNEVCSIFPGLGSEILNFLQEAGDLCGVCPICPLGGLGGVIVAAGLLTSFDLRLERIELRSKGHRQRQLFQREPLEIDFGKVAKLWLYILTGIKSGPVGRVLRPASQGFESLQ